MRIAYVIWVAMLCLAIAGFYVVKLNSELTTVKEEGKRISRHITFQLRLKNLTGQVARDVDLKIRVPNKEVGRQKCSRADADYPYTLSVDGVNNQLIELTFKELPPYGSRIITVNATVDVVEQPNFILEDAEVEQYINWNEPFVQYKDIRIKRVAQKMRGEDNIQSARNAYDWVVNNIDKESYNSRPKGAVYTLLKKRGDCTEFMHLFVALCRSNKIPARGVSGFFVHEDTMVYRNDLHDWAQIYIDGKWRVVDPFFGNFIENEDAYVALKVSHQNEDSPEFYRWSVNSENLVVEIMQ